MTKKKNLEWRNCSEEQLAQNLHQWALANPAVFQNGIIFLEGEMGAGKSTFARVLLSYLARNFSSQGSPTFPLVQEYSSKNGNPIYHIDLYRLKNQSELEDSGILNQIEEHGALALVEWPDLFPEVFAYWKNHSRQRLKNVVTVKILNPLKSLDSTLRDYILEA
jgi:tRNA threonylcarbamoyl adenosine modification protein YjeE